MNYIPHYSIFAYVDTVSIDGDDDDGIDGKMGPLSVNGQIKAIFNE